MTELFDPDAIPTDPLERVLRIPIPPREDGRPCYPREELRPERRLVLAKEHDERVVAILKQREILLDRCAKDRALRQEVLALCAKDIVFWINHFMWTIDPRIVGSQAEPFVLYPAQEPQVRFYEQQFLPSQLMTWLDEKSRAWGWTWIHGAACPTHSFLFNRGFHALIGGVTQLDVDNGGMEADAQSHMGKVRFILQNLPVWMRPDGMLDNEKLNKLFSLRNPTNGNTIKGKQYGKKFGRSQRFTIAVCDEAAWSDEFESAMTSLSETTPRVHIGSTPQGRNNEYARIRFSKSLKRTMHTLFWAENPRLGPDYYWAKREAWGRTKVAQELDISYDASTSLAIFPTFSRGMAVTELGRYDENLPLCVAIDPGFDDPFAIVWLQRNKLARLWNIVDLVQYEGRPGEFFVPFLLGYIPDQTLEGRPWPYEYSAFEKEIIARHAAWGGVDEAVGDAYGASTSSSIATGRSLYDLFYDYGFVDIYPVKVSNKEDAIETVRKALPRIRISDQIAEQRTGHKDNPTIVECFEHYSWVDRTSPTGREMKRAPKHDRYCHAMDAIQQFFLWEDVEPTSQPVAPEGPRGGRDRGRRLGMHDTAKPFSLDIPWNPIQGDFP